MFEIAAVAFTTFFATIAPIDSAAVYAALTTENTPVEKRHMAYRGAAIATAILLVFAIFGDALLARLGISLAALRTAGGILLLLMGIEMVFARHSGATTTTKAEVAEAEQRKDISVFPLATPLLAGPGTMSAMILLIANSHDHIQQQLMVIGMMLLVMLISLALLLVAGKMQKLLGVTGLRVISRVFGILLSALAVQFMFDGILASGLLPG
jgi:multiple antibiotic resistance protein